MSTGPSTFIKTSNGRSWRNCRRPAGRSPAVKSTRPFGRLINLSRTGLQARHSHEQGDPVMDVHCSTCGEPWDVYHLRHEAIFETDLSQAEAEAWIECSNEVR